MADAAEGEKKKNGKGIAISILVVIGLGILPIGILGWGIASYFQSFREPRVETAGDTVGSAYLVDSEFTNVTKFSDSNLVVERLKKWSPRADKTKKVVEESVKAGVNPAVMMAIWGGEATFLSKNDDAAFGCGVWDRNNDGKTENTNPNFDDQLKCSIKAVKKAIDNKSPYDQPTGHNIFTRLFYNYTGAMKDNYNKYGYVAGVSNDRIIFLQALYSDDPDKIVIVTESSSLAAGIGPVVAGTYYPPYGPNMNKVTSYNNSPHGPKGHGAFPVRLASLMSSFTECKSCAVDYNITNNSMLPVYAAFDGKVAKAAISVHNSLGQYIGSVIYLISNDGTTGALYAHVKVLDGIKGGTTVKKGQVIAEVARRCKGNENPVTGQCTQFKSTDDHVHFQFYINKTGLSQDALIKLFPKK